MLIRCIMHSKTTAPTLQEALSAAGPAHDTGMDAETGVYVGCMYTEYLDGILAKQVRHAISVSDSLPGTKSAVGTGGLNKLTGAWGRLRSLARGNGSSQRAMLIVALIRLCFPSGCAAMYDGSGKTDGTGGSMFSCQMLLPREGPSCFGFGCDATWARAVLWQCCSKLSGPRRTLPAALLRH